MLLQWKLLTLFLFICIAISGFFNLEHSRTRAMLEARHTASTRLLCEFHVKFLEREGVTKDAYRSALDEFARENPSLVQQYVECVRTHQKLRVDEMNEAK